MYSLICRHSSSFKNEQSCYLPGRSGIFKEIGIHCIAETDFNIHALSATIADPEDVGGRYLKDFEVIITPDKREIEYTFVGSLKEAIVQEKRI